MAYVFALLATQCPAIQDPGVAIFPTLWDGAPSDPSASITTAAEAVVMGNRGAIGTPKQNRNAARLDNLGRYGGGAAGGIWWGLDILPATGLNVTVKVGQAGIDSGAELAADYLLTCIDNAVSRVWLSRGGSVNKVSSASGTPLGPPDLLTVWTFLGAVSFTAGVLDWIDRSGVLLHGRGGWVYRRTADPGVPGDAPPADMRLLAETAGGAYVWDGGAWRRYVNAHSVTYDDLAAPVYARHFLFAG